MVGWRDDFTTGTCRACLSNSIWVVNFISYVQILGTHASSVALTDVHSAPEKCAGLKGLGSDSLITVTSLLMRLSLQT